MRGMPIPLGTLVVLAALCAGCAAPPGRQLCDAIARRDVTAVQRVLAGPELDATRDYGTCVPADVFTVAGPDDTALTAIGLELLKAGLPAEASWQPKGQSATVTAIEAAANKGNADLVRGLVAVGLDLTSLEVARALVQAAGAGHVAVVTLLVESGVDLGVTAGGVTALDRARDNEREEVVAYLERTMAERAERERLAAARAAAAGKP